jgi:hypothetical protein
MDTLRGFSHLFQHPSLEQRSPTATQRRRASMSSLPEVRLVPGGDSGLLAAPAWCRQDSVWAAFCLSICLSICLSVCAQLVCLLPSQGRCCCTSRLLLLW